MGNKFASGRASIADCDRCGQRFKLLELRTELVKQRKNNLLVCPACWDKDHPQLMLGMYPINDPQAVRNPRPDTTYVTSGPAVTGYLSGGSRDLQWGWAPVGGSSFFTASLTPNYLASRATVGTVTTSAT